MNVPHVCDKCWSKRATLFVLLAVASFTLLVCLASRQTSFTSQTLTSLLSSNSILGYSSRIEPNYQQPATTTDWPGWGEIDGYYFDKAISKTFVEINNELAAFYFYRTATHVDRGRCNRLSKFETNKEFDFTLFCDDVPLEKDCLIYSFGINYKFDNEEKMRDKYGCKIFTFDPSMVRMKKGLTQNIRPNIDFMRVGLSNVDRMIANPTSSKTSESSSKDGKNEPWQLNRFSTILKMLNHTTTMLDLLMIDAEGAEFGFFEDFVASGTWRNVKQLCIELHFFPGQHAFYVRHARALHDFVQLKQFIQVTHKLHPIWDVNAGAEFRGKQATYLVVHYINKAYYNNTLKSND